jgi:cobalt-zinc-cadmium efflux system outer membrane protein
MKRCGTGRKRGGLGCALLALLALPAAPASGQAVAVTLDEAIRLALANSPAIQAARTAIEQGRAQEITAGLRPNPLLSWDAQFLPAFHPSLWSGDYAANQMQFDAGLGYLFERGGKRSRRVDAARGETGVTEAQVRDAERTLTFNVAQQFVAVLLAKANLAFAEDALKSYRETVRLNEERRRAGDISEGDLLKIKIQMLQFETDVSAARLSRVQALVSLRQLVGYESVPAEFDAAGDLAFEKRADRVEELEALALRQRPDLRAAALAVDEARSQVALAEANGKQDPNITLSYAHASGTSSLSAFFTIPLALSNRNQGEIARTRSVLAQAEFARTVAEEAVKTDVRNAYEAVTASAEVVALYESGYLAQALESRDITEFAYRRGAASLIDYLDAERSYRTTQLAYRQALATYRLAVEQLHEAVGSR